MQKREFETTPDVQVGAIKTENLLEHWQGHRRVTRRVIEAFPETELFNYSIGGMRSFAELVMEMLGMAIPGMTGIVTRKWGVFSDDKSPRTKAELLARWDEATAFIDAHWANIPDGRFQEMDVAFGQWEGRVYSTLFYFIDNEIHHRGQGFVYLRSLGIEPPAFWDRS